MLKQSVWIMIITIALLIGAICGAIGFHFGEKSCAQMKAEQRPNVAHDTSISPGTAIGPMGGFSVFSSTRLNANVAAKTTVHIADDDYRNEYHQLFPVGSCFLAMKGDKGEYLIKGTDLDPSFVLGLSSVRVIGAKPHFYFDKLHVSSEKMEYSSIEKSALKFLSKMAAEIHKQGKNSHTWSGEKQESRKIEMGIVRSDGLIEGVPMGIEVRAKW